MDNADRLEFYGDRLAPPSPHYVCWLDVMGTRGIMMRSLPTCANFVGKLHIAACQSRAQLGGEGLRLYPVMDGMYVTSVAQQEMLSLLSATFRRLANEFVSQARMEYRFIVKASLACGPIVHGSDMLQAIPTALQRQPDYWDALLIGMPMVQAVEHEKLAPPFGVYVHESVRAFEPEENRRIPYNWWSWFFRAQPPFSTEAMRNELSRYYDWCRGHSHGIGYDAEDIQRHRELAMEYFADTSETIPVDGT